MLEACRRLAGFAAAVGMVICMRREGVEAFELGPPSTVSVSAYNAPGIAVNGPVPGSCGYGSIPATQWPYSAVASIMSNDSVVAGLPYEGCGTCFQLSCAGQDDCRMNALPLVVFIIDSCPTCTSTMNLINVPPQRFVSLADQPSETVQVTVQQVDCAPPGNIIIRVLNNPPQDLMLELVLLNVAGSGELEAVQLKNSQQDNSAWVPMSVYDGAIWQASQLPPDPLDLRIINEAGQQVVATNFYNGGSGGDFQTGVQFPPSANLSATPPSTPFPPPEQAPRLTASPTPAIFPPPQTPPVSPSLVAAAPALQLPGSYIPANNPAIVHMPPKAAPLIAPQTVLPPQAAPEEGVPSPTVAGNMPVQAPAPGGIPTCPGDTSNLQIAPAQPPNGAACRTLLSILQQSPSLSNWLSFLQQRGLDAALSNPTEQLTMFAPINSAFTCNIFEVDPLPGESTTIQQLVASSSNSLAALVGGQVVPGLYTSSQLSPGLELNTTDIVRDGSGQNAYIGITVAPASVNGPIKVQGVGSVVSILEPDIAACGPSVIQVTDSFLLPFAPTSPVSVPTPGVHASEGPPQGEVKLAFG